MAGSLRGIALPIVLLSGSIWLATPLGCIASVSSNWLEGQGSESRGAAAHNSRQAGLQDSAKRPKPQTTPNTHLRSVSGWNAFADPSPLAASEQSWAVIMIFDGGDPETNSLVAMEPPSPLNSEAVDSEAVNSGAVDSGAINSEAMDNGEESATDVEGALDLSPELIEGSPTLQRWLQEVPDLLSDIAHDPSFRTRLRAGYSHFPSTDQKAGFHVGVEDVFVGRTGLTVSGDYHQNGDRDRQSYGVDLRYYLLSLGGRLNVAPVLGYRHLKSGSFDTDGVNLGVRLLVVPSRTGAADISLTQSWISPASSEEVGVTTLSLGYAVTHDLRISTDVQVQNSPIGHDSRVGISLEWML